MGYMWTDEGGKGGKDKLKRGGKMKKLKRYSNPKPLIATNQGASGKVDKQGNAKAIRRRTPTK